MKAKKNAPTTGALSILEETINNTPPLLTHHHNHTNKKDMGMNLYTTPSLSHIIFSYPLSCTSPSTPAVIFSFAWIWLSI